MSPPRPYRARPALLLAGLLAACGQGLHLEGSVTELLDLRYERAEALGTPSEISVRFITPQGSGENTVLKVAANLDGVGFSPPQPVDLAAPVGQSPDGAQRGTVSRSVQEEPVRAFPRIARGSLTFERPLTPGARVPGHFHVTFVNGTDVYSGRTVFGRFEAHVP